MKINPYLAAIMTLGLLSLSFNTYAGDIQFWNAQRKGANFFDNNSSANRFKDAANAGIVIARVAPNKWLNGRPKSELGDFLLGPKDQYAGIVKQDLSYLLKVLDDANRAGLKVVLTMLSLPGSRWKQHNCVNGTCEQQYDLWKDFKYHNQSAAFWRDLASALKNHPAIAGYNILNEPCPERGTSKNLQDWYTGDYRGWYQRVKGTPADLNLFYKTVIHAIREVDKDTPIVLDSGFYANPYAFQVLDPNVIGDSKVLYAIHNYEPARYTTGDIIGKYSYPGDVPTGELDSPDSAKGEPPFAPVEHWDSKKFESFFKVVADWQSNNNVPASRIYVAEIGGFREAVGILDFFKDEIEFLNTKGWHWSFYAYREDDDFPQMDYELGTGKLPSVWGECSKDYTCGQAGIYQSNPLWTVFQNGLK